ncbi:kelch-like protein 23 [Genypterus blacodes]|uniref:kelch-like protein 23 n=1 Tax=Genypterus blacodes TaxID=154954 RepID=UPI003F773CED
MSHKEEIYTYDFCDTEHPSELLDALRHFYISGVFTDVTLQCAQSGQEFHCHKAVLSARSSYFKVMFTADMREKSTSVINMTGIDGSVLGALVNYVYTAQVCIDERNVQSLLEAADLLQFSTVKQACEEFLVRLLDVDNCLGMQAFAQLHLCPRLEREARRMMLNNFTGLIEQEEFLELDHDRMRCVLAAHFLSVLRDEVLIDAVAKWITHDLDNRIYYATDLLHSIHLDLDGNYFKAALEGHRECLLDREGTLKSVIIQAVKPSCREMPANRKQSSSIYIIGGYYWHPLCEVHIWDLTSNTWVQGKDMPDNTRESYCVTVLGADIYVTGGFSTNTVEALDTVSIYNCDSDEWTEGCPMITARYYHCSVTLHGCVYAMGGYRKTTPEKEAEFYDPLKKKWFPVADMIQGVGNATACGMRGKIYVTGDHYGYKGTISYENIQQYSPDVNEWTIITTSPHPEYGLVSVSLHNKLYVVGGQTTTAVCYDSERNEWGPISMLKEMRMECGAVAVNGCIYVTGGYSHAKGAYLESIEKYDPELDSWEIVGTLPGPSRSHGCVCVYSV